MDVLRALRANNPSIAIGAGAMAVALLLVVTTLSDAIADYGFARHGQSTQGLVTEKRVPPANNGEANAGNSQYVIRYRYSVLGSSEALTGQAYVGATAFNSVDVGDAVTVEYRSDAPQTSRINGLEGENGASWLFMLLAIVCGAAGAVFFRRGLYEVRLAAYLRQHGRLVTARIVDFERSKFRSDHEQLFSAVYEFDPGTGQLIRASTGPRPMAEYGTLATGDTIDIYVEKRLPFRSVWQHDAGNAL